MTYRVCYEDGWAPMFGQPAGRSPERAEYFLNEGDALRRADKLLRAGVHHRISVIDGADNVLSGIRLELKLGATVAE